MITQLERAQRAQEGTKRHDEQITLAKLPDWYLEVLKNRVEDHADATFPHRKSELE
jgi:hypothetical protein